ncbi:MAG: hypothetical protein EXS13_01685 [Planctomycetes bacterium]|nr:hypothetical protein [Planctomycetota bacterium]
MKADSQLDPHPSGGAPVNPLGWSEHEPYVRALLRRLVVDPELVDDLAQETWLTAVRHSAAAIFLQRAWLGTVP